MKLAQVRRFPNNHRTYKFCSVKLKFDLNKRSYFVSFLIIKVFQINKQQ